MPSAFITNDKGEQVIVADPHSDLDYSISCWLEGLIFLGTTTWEISPSGPTLYGALINQAQIIVDGITYDIGKVASTWIKDLVVGVDYKVTVKAVFTGNRKDDRSFTIQCRQK